MIGGLISLPVKIGDLQAKLVNVRSDSMNIEAENVKKGRREKTTQIF